MWEERPSSITSFLLASISLDTSSLSRTIGGLGGREFGRKDFYAISPERLLIKVPARLLICSPPLSKRENEITTKILLLKFHKLIFF